ncbi:MAG: IS66 family transposase [Bdellovibrionia bacterium]
MNYQLIPFERTSEICEDLFNHPISLGTLMNFSTQGFRSLKATELKIKAALIHSDVLHVDESGIACEGKNQWLHVASSSKLTHFAIHPRRGLQAMEEIGIIPEFRGTMVHDHFNPYFNYKSVKHALCNAHILRELNFIQESDNKEEWAGAMKSLLIKARDFAEEWNKRSLVLPEEEVDRLEVEFDEIIAQGLTYHRKKNRPRPNKNRDNSKPPKHKQPPGKNLLDRLQNKKSCVLKFLRDPNVPFTNNRAERDIRMNKLKQKISGCFRSHGGAAIFCRIRSYISCAKKQGHSPLFALAQALNHRPLHLT